MKNSHQQTILPFVLQGNAMELEPPGESTVSEPPKKKIKASKMAAMYTIPLHSLVKESIQRHKRELTMVPSDNAYGGAPSPPFETFVETDTSFSVPRFYGFKQWGQPDIFETSEGLTMTVPFKGKLNPVQEEATTNVIEALTRSPHGAMLVLPCGYGKTVCALYVAHAMKRRTLVLVHKGFLVQQWHERTKAFLPGATVGKIQQNVVDADADVTVAMIQSVSKRDYPERILMNFGLIIIDEAHHMAAPVFSSALRCLPSKYVLGLSATPERKDGMTKLLHYSMGDIAYRIERKPEHTLVSCMLYEGGKRKEIVQRNGQISLPLMLNQMVEDDTRNQLIADRICEYIKADRHIIVLTDRIKQLHKLMQMMIAKGVKPEDISYYIGNTPANERHAASERRVILSTYSMAKEGLDIPRLDTLVMATPKGDIVQASGRVQRKHSEKRVPLIVDIVDTFSVFEALRWKRWNFYRKEKFNCQTFGIGNTDAEWFV